jgi:hypothetical protein
MVEYRGAISATLLYDRQPVMDHFRKVNEQIVLGAVEARGIADTSYFALLRTD